MDSVYVALNSLRDSSQNYTEYLSLIIAGLAVILSPFISYVISKNTIKTQMKIAESNVKAEVLSRNRQSWINALRDCLSEFIALGTVITQGAFSSEVFHEKMEKFFLIRTKLSLLINPLEEDHSKLDVLLGELLVIVLNKQKDAYGAKREEIIKLAQPVLKREWVRVKDIN